MDTSHCMCFYSGDMKLHISCCFPRFCNKRISPVSMVTGVGIKPIIYFNLIFSRKAIFKDAFIKVNILVLSVFLKKCLLLSYGYMFLNMCVQDVRRPEENVGCPGLELQADVSCLVWVLLTEPGSSR